MDNEGNLTQIEKEKLAKFLTKAKFWWNNDINISETIDLINDFEDFRKEMEKD